MNIHEKLKSLRHKKYLTQTEAAKELGLSRQILNQYENGKMNPSPSRLRLFADYYGVSADYFLGNNSEAKEDTDLSVEEKLLLDKFSKLSKDGKLQLFKMAEFLLYGSVTNDMNQ